MAPLCTLQTLQQRALFCALHKINSRLINYLHLSNFVYISIAICRSFPVFVFVSTNLIVFLIPLHPLLLFLVNFIRLMDPNQMLALSRCFKLSSKTNTTSVPVTSHHNAFSERQVDFQQIKINSTINKRSFSITIAT